MRITADIIDGEPCLECNTKKSPGSHLSIVLRESKCGASELPGHELVESMLKQFQKLSIRFVPNSSKTVSEAEHKKNEVLLSDRLMDSGKELNESKKYEACCISYAEKMKDEIKKEVIDEVLKILRESQPPIASSTAVSNKVVHPGIFCDHCDQQICGVRYKCGNCEDFDLCEDCEKIPGIHSYRHVFLKLRYPFSLCVDAEEPKSGTEACMVRNENGSYIFRPKSAPSKAYKETGFMKKTLEKPLEFNAKFLYDETIEDGEVITAGKPFLKKWRVANNGLTSWEKDVVVARLFGSDELTSDTSSVTAPPLKPGEEGFVIVYFTAPRSEGNFACYWEFRHQGKSFGDTLWCHIRVGLHSSIKLPFHFAPAATNNIQPKSSSSKPFFGSQAHCMIKSRRKAKEERQKRKESRKKEVKQIVDVLTAVQEEQGCRRPNSESLKPVVTSHTATPNNTPFDLSPPKSPEPQEFIEVKTDAIISYVDAGLPDLEKFEQQVNIVGGNECDEKLSINTISSSESDSEFVVIPMPKCFSVLENVAVSQAASTQAPDPAVNYTNEEYSAATTVGLKQSPTKPSGNTEQVSQETGAPEEAENFNVDTEIQVKEISVRRKEITSKSSFRLNHSPSSSSVSVIESEDNMSPSAPSAPPLARRERHELPLEFTSTHVQAVHDYESTQNCTFPKFPLDTEDPPMYSMMSSSNSSANTESTSVSTPSPVHETERTIQVLPEGLVTGALVAAASVYNTAKAVFSSIQPNREEMVESSHQSQGSARSCSGATAAADSRDSLQQLIEMGFCNRALNERLLREKKGDVAAVVADLVNMDDSDWYASRTPDAASID